MSGRLLLRGRPTRDRSVEDFKLLRIVISGDLWPYVGAPGGAGSAIALVEETCECTGVNR